MLKSGKTTSIEYMSNLCKCHCKFSLIDNFNEVKIFLAKPLVYENVNEYTLTLQVRNSPDLVAEAQLIIKIKDVNNLVSISDFCRTI